MIHLRPMTTLRERTENKVKHIKKGPRKKKKSEKPAKKTKQLMPCFPFNTSSRVLSSSDIFADSKSNEAVGRDQ